MHPIRRAVISIGSNLGERRNNLQGARRLARGHPRGLGHRRVSSVYETEPVDAPEGSKDFLNAVVLLDTTLSARTLLERALAVESAYGRERTGERNAPRTLDVDLIVVGDRRADEEDLTLPHPRAAERAFVLVPVARPRARGRDPGCRSGRRAASRRPAARASTPARGHRARVQLSVSRRGRDLR